jgi:hypothetical protein
MLKKWIDCFRFFTWFDSVVICFAAFFIDRMEGRPNPASGMGCDFATIRLLEYSRPGGVSIVASEGKISTG